MEFKNLVDLTSSYYFAVPDYQRDYSWMPDQINTLFNDVANLVLKEEEGNHFLGALVTIPFDPESASMLSLNLEEYRIDRSRVMHVVDGQQRLTTVSILVQAILDSIDDNIKNQLDFGISRAKRILHGDNCIKGTNSPAPHLILNGNTGRFYNSSILKIRNDEFTKKQVGYSRMNRAYNIFKTQIEDLRSESKHIYKDDVDFYDTLLTIVTNNLEIVEIKCPSSTNAFQVFDSLNGKGLDLTAADRIKNLYLSWCPSDKRKDYDWKNIEDAAGKKNLVQLFSNYLFINNGGRISKHKIPDVFKDNFKDLAVKDFDSFYQQLLFAAKEFGKLKNYSTGLEKLDKVVLRDLNDLKQEQVNTMLLAVPLKYNDYSNEDYCNYANALTNLIVRMSVCQKNMNKLDNFFTEFLREMDKGADVKQITAKIKKKQSEITSDEEFKSNFARLKLPDTKVAQYYLRKIDNYLRSLNNDRRDLSRSELGSDAITIEHVIPQYYVENYDCISDWYRGETVPEISDYEFKENVIQSIGNMALIYADDNSAASNNSYNDKFNIYMNGSMNKDLGSPANTFYTIKHIIENYPDKFTDVEVANRAEEFAEYALKIWN